MANGTGLLAANHGREPEISKNRGRRKFDGSFAGGLGVHSLNAQANRETQILVAQGAKESQFLAAEALLEMKNKESQGIQKIGEAEAEALRLKELAPISAQIELARAIGENGGYQGYLIAIRQLEACEVIGVEQAKAMSQADLKVIAKGGSIGEGMNDIKDIISAKGACSSVPC